MLEAASLILLAAVLLTAVARPRGLSESVVAVPAALIALGIGAVGWSQARDEVTRLGPVVGFLAAVLALAAACADEGLFTAVGGVLARFAGGSAERLLLGAVVAAAVTTAVLSLDTTVLLLTPVVLATGRQAALRPRPSLYATGQLANTGSLLLPVSNLTNLLALAVVPITFARFAALMALPWLVATTLTYLALRRFFAPDLSANASPQQAASVQVPRFALVVVVATLAGFVATSFVGVAPVWAAAAGAAVLVGKRLLQRRTTPVAVVRSAAPSFCVFVLALGVVVRAVGDHGLGDGIDAVLPGGSSLLALLGVAAASAVLANLLNNLPATLLLLPVAAAAGGVASVLAVLVGVNIGPNLTYGGSLATLLWRRSLTGTGVPRLGEFTRLGAVTVPVVLVATTVALWASIRLIGLH